MTDDRDTLTANALQVWGERGRAWLDGLDAHVGDLAADWGLEIVRVHPLTFHWVAAVRCSDGTPAVLKVGVTDGHLEREAAALRAFDGRGAVRLLRADTGRGALLLESAEPGETAEHLVPRDDERATAVLVDLMGALHAAPAPAVGLPHLREEGATFAAHLAAHPGDDPLPRRLVERATSLFDELVGSCPGEVVLHGDLHHANALTATRSPWLAIDPHGLVGDPGYDAGQFLYNPLGPVDAATLAALAPRRVEQVADGVGLPEERVRAWGFVVCVLSEVWSAEDGHPIDGVPLAVARALEADL